MSFGQDSSLASSEITYYGKDFFRLEGTVISDSLKENRMIDCLSLIKIL